MQAPQHAHINETELEYEVLGSGEESVILIHGAIVADSFAPLLAAPAFSRHFEEYRIVNYHRRGYAGSKRADGPVSIAEQASDCAALLRYLGIEQAHVVGHSYGGTIALQFAIDNPGMVHSLALLEPLLPREALHAQEYTVNMVTRGMGLYSAGKKEEAAVEFLKMAAGDQVWEWVERMLPADAYSLAVSDADTFFQVEVPALLDWLNITKDGLRKIHLAQPTLSVLGSESDAVWPGFQEIHEFLLSWLPRVEAFDLPGATHAMHIMNPHDAAEGLAEFLARHAMGISQK